MFLSQDPCKSFFLYQGASILYLFLFTLIKGALKKLSIYVVVPTNLSKDTYMHDPRVIIKSVLRTHRTVAGFANFCPTILNHICFVLQFNFLQEKKGLKTIKNTVPLEVASTRISRLN